jgi:hypothetical protein
MRTSHARHLNEIEFALRELAAEFDPNAVPLCEAPKLWQTAMRAAGLAESIALLLAPRVDEAGAWKRNGHRTVADQLAADAGTSVNAAQRLLDTSKRVAEQPKTERALRAGELSMVKAELVAEAIEVAPDSADELLDLAKTAPVAKVRQHVLRTKAAVNADENYVRIRKERSARHYTDAGNAWHFHATGTVDDGAAFVQVFEPIVDELFKAAYQEGRRESRDAYAFDALMEMARRASGEDAGTKSSQRPQLLGLVRVDHAALSRGHVEGDEVCEIAGLGPVPVTVARDLLGESVLKLVLTKGVDVANVTHLGTWADGGAEDRPVVADRGVHRHRLHARAAHRVRPPRRLGQDPPHAARRGDGLCSHHHDVKTLHGWALVEGTGKRPMVPPEDPRHPKNKRSSRWTRRGGQLTLENSDGGRAVVSSRVARSDGATSRRHRCRGCRPRLEPGLVDRPAIPVLDEEPHARERDSRVVGAHAS